MIWGFAILAGLVGVEAASYLYYRKLKSFIEEKKTHNYDVDHKWMENYLLNDLDSNELKKLIKKSVSYKFTQNEDGYYTTVPCEEIPKDQMLRWTSYNLYYKTPEQLDEYQFEYSKCILEKIEKKLEVEFEDIGNNKEIYFLQFGGNDIYTSYKPLIVYTGLNIVKNITYMRLYKNGFKKYLTTKSNITYFYYYNEKHTNTTIFVHGLGFGITPYISYILDLTKTTNLIVPILPNISNMEFTGFFSGISDEKLFPTYENWRYDFKQVLKDHDVKKFDIIGHSFGTIIIGILLKDKWINNRLNKKILVDPVCFIDRSYKIFRYINEPYTGDKNPLVNKLFNMVVYNDIHLRYVTQRYLFGPEFWITNYNNMNLNNCLIVLSKNDQIVSSRGVYKRLREHNIPCIMAEEAGHSQIFLFDKFKSILGTIKDYLLF